MADTEHDQSRPRVPDDIAQAVVLPESYGDEANTTYPAFRWLRENMPLGQAHVDGYDPLWLVTKYDDIMTVERDAELFNATDNNPILQTQAGDEFIKSVNDGSHRLMDAFPFMDPPEHTKMRKTTGNWFMPKNAKRFEDQMREIAREDVEKILSFDNGEFDYVTDFALYFPLRVVMSLFGMPLDDMPFMLKITQEFFGPSDPAIASDAEESNPDQASRAFQQAINEAYEWFGGFIEDRRENPQDDLLSMIANAKTDDGELLPESFVCGQYMQTRDGKPRHHLDDHYRRRNRLVSQPRAVGSGPRRPPAHPWPGRRVGALDVPGEAFRPHGF